MFYYRIASNLGRDFHKLTATYSYPELLKSGQIVKIPWGNKIALGLIIDNLEKPDLELKKIKAIGEILPFVINPIYCQLYLWICNYYLASPEQTLKLLIPSQNFLGKTPPITDKASRKIELNLSSRQQEIAEAIFKSKERNHLIEAITGSGKTYIYLWLALQYCQKNISSLILVPEIFLSKEIFDRIQKLTSVDVVHYHSELTPLKRRIIYQRVLAGETMIVIGTRSSLFLPFKNLGLIVLDEEHDLSYKQDSGIRYHARDVSAQLANLFSAKLVLGSATPGIWTKFLTQNHKIVLHKMNSRYGNIKLPKVEIVSLKEEQDGLQKDLQGIISRRLLREINTNIRNNFLTMLLVNRRGSSNSIVCNSCNEIARCPRCNTPLTYHHDENLHRCHFCQFQTSANNACLNCQDFDWLYFGIGTKSVVSLLNKYLPKARIARIDQDNAKNNYHLLAQANQGEIDILVGTQMISKGLNLQNLKTVGIISLEQLLSVPDFASLEKVYIQLHQVAGRAGRSDLVQDSNVILQCFNPRLELLKYFLNDGSQDEFYQEELYYRQKFHLPPFVFLSQIIIRGKNQTSLLTRSKKIQKHFIDSRLESVSDIIILPKKVDTKFQAQIILKSKNRNKILNSIKSFPSPNFYWNLDCHNLLS